MDILRINIKSLKFFLLWPGDNFVVGIDDINIIIEAIIGIGDYFGFAFIYVCFRFNLPKVKRIIRNASIFLEYCDQDVLNKAEEEVQLYTKGLMIYFSFGLTVNTLLPLLDYTNCNEKRLSDYYRMHDPCGFPTRTWCPFEVKNAGLFYILLALHTNSCINIAYTVLCITMTLIGLLIHITAQINNLRKHISDVFKPQYGEVEDSEVFDMEIENKIKFCVKYHIAIIEYTNDVFEAFNVMLIMHVSLTSMIFGIICYQIVSVDAFMDKLRYTLHLMGWVGMLFLTCLYGQNILDESTTIADAAYHSEWYDGPISSRKTLCLIIMRSQRPLKLRAASIGVISLSTFVSVIKTAYSYFTLLLTIAE